MPTLHDWYLNYNDSPTDSFIQAWGVVEGHPKQPDGTFIHTSEVKSVHFLDNITLVVETRNNAYKLDCRELQRDYVNETRKAVQKMELSEREWDIITQASIRAFIEREQAHREYRNKLDFGEMYMILSTEKPNGVDEVYFCTKETDGSLYAATCLFSVHVGMFTDSVLYHCHHADHTYDVLRFFPHAPDRIEFYHTWDGKQDGVWGYFRNVGKKAVIVELPWGKEIVVEPDTEIKVSFGDGVDKDEESADWMVLSDLSAPLKE